MRAKFLGNFYFILLAGCFISTAKSEEQPQPESFGELHEAEKPAEYPREVDRQRGVIKLNTKNATYVSGDHYANWHWKESSFRAGSYFAALNYRSNRSKLGVRARIGNFEPVKGYAPRTARNQPDVTVLGKSKVEKTASYPVILLTEDQSNVDDFMVDGLSFFPAPEGELVSQGIDGSIILPASSATTYSTKMFYQSAGKLLTNWQEQKDWVEWEFDVSNPEKFEVVISQRGTGSKIDILIDGELFTCETTPVETGDSWRSLSVGTIELKLPGRHKLAIIPRKKLGDSIMELQHIEFNPTN